MYFAFATGVSYPTQCTALPNTGAVLALENIQIAKAKYASDIAPFPIGHEAVLICTVKYIRNSRQKKGGKAIPDKVFESITPESWAAGIAKGLPYGYTSTEFTDSLDNTPTVSDVETTGDLRPDWQYYPTATVEGQNASIVIHRDRDDIPDNG